MTKREVRTQEELDAALAAGEYPLCVGDRVFSLQNSARAVLWESARAVLWESARAELWDKASADLRDSARAVLWDRASAVLRDSASVIANGHSVVRVFSRNAKVTAGPQVVVVLHCDNKNISGGVIVRQTMPQSAAEWCAHYGVAVNDGVAILFKGVDAEFQSPHGVSYRPGTIPVAPDWDGGKEECGGGLHFSPHPTMVREFIDNPAHYIACPVALKDIAVHPDGVYPQKVKARGCCAPVWECDEESSRRAEMGMR